MSDVISILWADTNNDLQEELDGGYEGITVAVPWQTVSADTLGAVHKMRDIPRGAESDCECLSILQMTGRKVLTCAGQMIP